MRNYVFAVFFIACIVFLAPISVHAQGTDASIAGTIVDEQNSSPLPGATVAIENVSTGFSTGTTTGANAKESNFGSEGRNGLLSLRSQFSSNWTNDLKLGYYWNRWASGGTKAPGLRPDSA